MKPDQVGCPTLTVKRIGRQLGQAFVEGIVCPFFLVLLIALLAAAPVPASAQPIDPCRAADVSISDTDRLHPFNYVNLVEVTRRGERFPIHLSDPDSVEKYSWFRPHSFVEVDRNSTLELSFSRRWIASQPDFQGKIHLTGTLNGEPLPIPGYSEVGERPDTGTVDLESTRAVITSFCTIHNSTETLQASITDVGMEIARTDSLATMQQRTQFIRVTNLERDVANLEDELANADSADAEELNEDLRKLRRELERERADKNYVEYLALFTSGSLVRVRTSLEQIAPVFETLTSKRNAAAVDLVARRVGRDPRMLTAAASRLTTQLDSVRSLGVLSSSSDPAARRRASELVIRLANDLKELTAVASEYLGYLQEADLNRDPALLEELKDSRILLRRHDAKRGDRIIITVLNRMADEDQAHRELDLDIRVDRFGWDSDVTDSFIFMRRLNADYESVPPSVTAVERSFAAGTAARDTTIKSEVGVNFELIPGASYTWSHRSRRGFTWLQPSFGVNVSFPKFQTKTYHITRPEGEDATVSRVEETTNNSFDLAIGGIVSVFDGTLGVTVGRAATVQRAPWYWGVSLSFLKLAKNAANVLPGS
jgi:hypothetical protein